MLERSAVQRLMTSVDVSPTPLELGRRAATKGAEALRTALSRQGRARAILATGASQFATLDHLVREPGIDWSRVTVFHLDEYIGLPPDHPASFRRYLRERFVARVGSVDFIPVEGDAPAQDEIVRLGALLAQAPVDVCFAGLGENCHVAFNDPPADFITENPFLVVTLDEACRRQQLGEGWFATLDDVPTTALSMSIRQIMRSTMLILSVPERRKAAAVRDMLHQPIDPRYPGTILREHANAHLFVDTESASLANLPA
ncbi:MAG: glucosamine-6-phosphate deaminase [Pseudomonadota bacterium]|nr:glucosamine-6-phosphate deaminase [Pseudomonadota bacterium]